MHNTHLVWNGVRRLELLSKLMKSDDCFEKYLIGTCTRCTSSFFAEPWENLVNSFHDVTSVCVHFISIQSIAYFLGRHPMHIFGKPHGLRFHFLKVLFLQTLTEMVVISSCHGYSLGAMLSWQCRKHWHLCFLSCKVLLRRLLMTL